MNQQNIPLPFETAKEIEKFFDERKISNLNLILTKYINAWRISKNNSNVKDKRNQLDNDSMNKEMWDLTGEDIGKYIEAALKINYDKKEYESFFKRWKLLLNSVEANQFKSKVQWRLIVGLGSESVLETSITLHHIYGVPYIPATAFKGVVSSYYIEKNRKEYEEKMEAENKKEKDNKKKEYNNIEDFLMNEDKKYIKLFGNKKNKGKVIFLDAYPINFPKLEIDIINPHYQNYYKGGSKPPADWMEPNPIKFISVAKNTEFLFAFIGKDNNIIDETKELIEGALKYIGIGAKTSVGYGFFDELEEIPKQILEELPKKLNNISNNQLPQYLKNINELKDEFLRDDGNIKSEDEYKIFIKNKGLEYTKKRKLLYEKALKWYKKNKIK